MEGPLVVMTTCAPRVLTYALKTPKRIEQITRRPAGGSTTGVVRQRALEATTLQPNTIALSSAEGRHLTVGTPLMGVCAHCHYWYQNMEGIRRTTKQSMTTQEVRGNLLP